MDTPPPLGAPKRPATNSAKGSFPWVQTVGIVVAVAGVGAAVVAMAKRASRPEPPSTPLVQTQVQPKTVVVDLSQLAAPDPSRLEQASAATRPSSDGDLSADMNAAPGTGVIAVKTGGKTKVAKVAKVADKPYEPTRNYYDPPAYTPPAGRSSNASEGPRVYGEPTPEELDRQARQRERDRQRRQRGVTYREATQNQNDPLLPFSGSR